MNKNLTWKLIVIVATLLLFAYGIVGVPSGASGSALLSSLQNRIHLGLDLKGGTHLILQVQVNDAVNVDSDNAIEALKSGMRTGKINYAEITKPDPAGHPEQIVIKGVAPWIKQVPGATNGLIFQHMYVRWEDLEVMGYHRISKAIEDHVHLHSLSSFAGEMVLELLTNGVAFPNIGFQVNTLLGSIDGRVWGSIRFWCSCPA